MQVRLTVMQGHEELEDDEIEELEVTDEAVLDSAMLIKPMEICKQAERLLLVDLTGQE